MGTSLSIDGDKQVHGINKDVIRVDRDAGQVDEDAGWVDGDMGPVDELGRPTMETKNNLIGIGNEGEHLCRRDNE